MRILLSIILFTILSACSTTGFSKQSSIVGPFKVVGRGHSEESAKNDGFKKAIEYSMGVAIQSERIIQNDNVSRK